MEPSLIINDKTYLYVKTRIYTPVSVYQGEGTFLRIGPRDLVEKELMFHKELLNRDFPVPVITESGVYQNQFYYIEKSFGDRTFGDLFYNEFKQDARISDTLFASFLSLVSTYAEAQLKTKNDRKWNKEEFFTMVHGDLFLEELTGSANKIRQAFDKAATRLQAFPAVLTHPDFNPHNLFEQGVIDLGDFAYGPAGYDLVTNIYHTYMFPQSSDYESYRWYHFSLAQQHAYFDMILSIFSQAGLPSPLEYKNDYMLCKSIWAAARMHSQPKLQQWRYGLFDKILEAYLGNEDIFELVTQ